MLFSSPDHEVLSELLCPSMSGVRRPCVRACVNNFFKQHLLWNRLLDWPNFTGMIPGWSPIKVVQTVPVGCISRSRGQKIVFQNTIFKTLLVRNYKAQRFHIWYIASFRGPLPKLFKLCPLGQNWPRPWGHNFALNYIRKTSNDIFSWTTNGNLTKLHRNDPCVVPDQSFWNRSSWLHK